MKEIGGYIEFEKFNRPMLHEGAIALNSGRNALAYLIKSKNIQRIALPEFICSSVINACVKNGTDVDFYDINEDFLPQDIPSCEYVYIVNFYGQLTAEQLKKYSGNVIFDMAQAYFMPPIAGTDNIYTCRKFFGVPDGAFLYTDKQSDEEFPLDTSADKMGFLLGRFEGSASDYYFDYVKNNQRFENEPIKRMSALTQNLLHGLDYEDIKNKRTENFRYLFNKLGDVNKLNLSVPEGAFSYPLLIDNGDTVRKQLQEHKIYIPCLWPNVLENGNNGGTSYKFAKNILPLPCDQRYSTEDMQYIIDKLKNFL